MSDAAPPPSGWRRRLRQSVFSSTALALLALAALIVMNELDRLIADVVSPSGRVHALSGVIGVGAALETEAWGDWAEALFPVEQLIRAHVVTDLLFIACYGVLLMRLLARVSPDGSRSRRWGRRFVCALVVADLVEDALLMLLSFGGMPGWVAGVQAAASYLKWAAVLVVLGYLFLSRVAGDTMRGAVSSGWRGIYAQRLVAIAVGAVAVVSLMTADGVIEQLPDVYRSWVGYGGLDVVPMLWTLVAFAATGLGLLWLARGRARRYFATLGADTRPASPLLPWYLTAAVVAVVGVALGLAQNRAPADWVPLGVFVLVLVAIPFFSWLIRRFHAASNTTSPDALRNADTSDDAVAARRAGDVLLILWVALAGLGPFKALVTPIALASTGAFDDSLFAGSFGWWWAFAAGLLVVGVAAAVAFRRWAAGDPAAPGGTGLVSTLGAAVQPGAVSAAQQQLLTHLGIVVLCVSGAVVLAFLIVPMAISAVVGAAAVIVLLVGAWTGILGWLTLSLGRRLPLDVFQVLRLRSAPVVTLLVVLPLVAASVQNAPSLHAVRFDASGTLPTRPPLETAFTDWYEGPSCATTVAGVSVKPLVLVAAEGGGIRAATWTVDVLRELPEASGCAADAVFASTGASGGSIGLASFRTDGNARGGGAAQTTIDFSGDDALSADLAGLLAGDLVGSVSGIRVPSSGTPHDTAWRWRDRTAMQETTWETQAPQFAEPFDADPVSPTGYLVMGSTDATSLCKVLVSQLNLSDGGWTETDGSGGVTDAAAPDCSSRDAEFASTIDLVDYLGDGCEANLTWASASELSARFPFVSPGGRIAPETLPAGCRDVADLQLVDGGSTDNSALGTWVDLAPALTGLVRETNAQADGDARPFVVPIVLFATNEPGSDVLVAPDGTRPEALVPLAAIFSAKGPQTSPSAWLRRASDAYLTACPPGSTECLDAVDAMRDGLPGGVVVASPSTDPAISVPLGWSLSSFSRSRLRFEAEGQALCGRDPARVSADALAAHVDDPCTANGEYGMLGTLLDHFDDATPTPVG